MVTFAPENAPVLKFTVSWPLGYNQDVKLQSQAYVSLG